MTTPDRVDALARELLLLSKDEQRRVARIVWALLDGPGAPEEPALETPPDEAAGVETWLDSIGMESPWHQLMLIDDAMSKVESDEATARLHAARKALLDQHPGASVRASVVDMARSQPIAVLVGVIGLVVAILGIAAKVLHLAF